MSFGPQIVMPGAFHLEAPNGAAPLSGVHAGIFRPPIAPSASNSIYMGKSTGYLYSDASTPSSHSLAKRKRPGLRGMTPMDPYDNSIGAGDETFGAGRTANGGPGEMRYTLAGQIETPNGEAQRELGDMEDSTYSDIDYRRALGSKRPHDSFDPSMTQHPLAHQQPRRPEQAQGAFGWALNTIGGVVGKVWEFCKEGAFRGFYAGGGIGYEVKPTVPPNGQVWCNEHDVPTLPNSIPGGFPESDYNPYTYERDTPESTPPPAAKRRHIHGGQTPQDELRKNWVMVEEPTDKRRASFTERVPSATHRSPTPSNYQVRPSSHRRISKPVGRLSTPSLGRRQSSRVSHAGSPSLSNRQPASFASPRSPVRSERPSTPSRLPVPVRSGSPSVPLSPHAAHLQSPHIPSPSPYASSSHSGHRRSHSAIVGAAAASATPGPSSGGEIGSMRRRDSLVHSHSQHSSPRLDAEAQHMVLKRRKQEREADARINDFNARLLDMIRQGKEALGTTVEVEDGDDDADVFFNSGGGGVDPWEDD
ncbi:hypothetical protein BX600DRAFT_428502 [Xylariales sp. PMI_506]|nr:hypothetical protein BX600DRAFT_428502 [Xylariales sp. PMI_506]